MSKENLFRQILRNDVVVWAGAGMSKYAGYPLGAGLRDILYQDLGAEGRAALNPTSPLFQMAEDYCSLKGGSRRDLNILLNNVFLCKPKSTETHDILAKITQIKTVITTNYDNLFENSYGDRGHKIFNASHLTTLDNDKVEIFKAHGDLIDPNSIIITSKDYSRFFQYATEYNAFWTTIKERLIGNSILFIGYGIEDVNVESMLSRIFEEIGANRREIFFVSPQLPPFKINELVRRGIQYIDETAENIVFDIFNHLKEHVLDFSKKNPKPNIVSNAAKFVNNFGIGFSQDNVDGQQNISSFFPTRPDIKGTLNFSLASQDSASQDLADFLQRKRINSITLPKDKLTALNFHLGGIRIPVDFTEFTIFALPNFEGNVSIRFDDGFEYSNVPAKLYHREDAVEINAKLKSGDLKFELFIKDRTRKGIRATLGFTHNRICSSVREELEMYTLLDKISKNEKFSVFGPMLLYQDVVSGLKFTDTKHFTAMSSYFGLLREIELRERIVFNDIVYDEITNQNYVVANYLVAKYKNEKVKESWLGELKMTTRDTAEVFLEKLLELKKADSVITAREKVEEYVELHGMNIRLGFLVVEYPSPYIVNEKKFLKGKDKELLIRSRDKIQYVKYLDVYEENV